MKQLLAEYRLHRTEDVFALRQGGRLAAAAIGCDNPGQVRIATVLSELGREAVSHGSTSFAVFWLANDELHVDIEDFPKTRDMEKGSASGLAAARRLVDVSTFDTGTLRCRVSVRLAPGRVHAPFTAATLRRALDHSESSHSLDEIRLENHNLVATLQELGERQEQLVHLNSELEETNRGVLAMYSQLAQELEETNRGVVALYAELDEKSASLHAASESKSRFLASVSHELRGPINSVLGLARLLMDPHSGALSENQQKEIGLIAKASGELLRLVNELLDLAKAESGKLEPAVENVSLAEVFAELRGALRPLARPGVELRVDIPEQGVLETDRTLLVQVLRNLLTNALKFTAEGQVCLSAMLVTPYEWEIVVSDTGIGVGLQHRERIFEEFYQVPGALQVQSKGTGLGLPYARRVTGALGGTLRLDDGVDSGSRFVMTLPRAWQPLLNAPETPTRQRAGANEALTVITIDDDEGFRRTLRGMLQGCAGRIVEAAGGIEALSLMRETRPDVAFLDLRMPDLDGTSVLRQMQSDPALRDIPVVIVTTVNVSVQSDAALAHAAALLSKANLNRESVHAALGAALALAGATP